MHLLRACDKNLNRSPGFALVAVRFGFAGLGLKSADGRIRRVRTIIGLVMPENIASVRVLEKTGLRYVETVTSWGNQFSKYVITP